MSQLPAFDVYEELEVTRTSSPAEITASFRRLALLHHPDKNANSDEATAKFQRLQASYETLNDPATRRQYDSRSSSSSNSSYDRRDDVFSTPWGFSFSHFFYDSADEFDEYIYMRRNFSAGRRGDSPTDEEEALRRAAASAREEEQTRIFEQQRAERAAKDAERAAKKRAMEESVRKMAEAAQSKQDNTRKVELEIQHQTWDHYNAVTVEDKQKYCMHTNTKWAQVASVKKGQKIDCGSCGHRRSPRGFQCPHCELIVCQVCFPKLEYTGPAGKP